MIIAPVDVQSTGENLEQNEASSEGVVLDHVQPSKSNGKRKAGDLPDSSKKAKKLAWTPEAVEQLPKFTKD